MSLNPWSKKKPANFRVRILLGISGITVSPAVTRLDLSADPAEFYLNYSNSTNHPVELKFSAKDFTSLEEGWRVKFLDNKDSSNYRYSLSSWLEFQPQSLLLTPGQSDQVRVVIRESALSGGGHYASVIADITTAPPEIQAINVNSQLASLVFVRTNSGQERDEARIAEFSPVSGSVFSLPDQYLLRFDNSGNTDLVPHGLVTVKDWLGREISRGIVNQDSLICLPETIRRYDVSTTIKLTKWHIPGPYQVSINLKYGQNQTLSSHLQFFNFAGSLNLILLILLLATFSLLIRLILKKMKRRQNLRP